MSNKMRKMPKITIHCNATANNHTLMRLVSQSPVTARCLL